MGRASAKRGGGGVGSGAFGLEAMEPRQMLAADLAVAWDTTNFHIPGIVVPGDTFNPAGGGGDLRASILVSNQGPAPAVGTTRIDFYLSTDTTLNPAQDILLQSFTGISVSLAVDTGDPSDLGPFAPNMRILPTVAPGQYFLIARLVPDSNIGDFNAVNNIAVSSDPITVARRFGDFAGRTGVPLALQSADGTIVAFAMSGGGFGDVTVAQSGFGVTLNGTGDQSQASVTTSGGVGTYNLTSVIINGSVGSFSAPNGRLTGDFTATIGYGAVTLGDVQGPLTITVPATSASPSFTLGNVHELSVASPVGITSITVSSWDDRDATKDSVTAPWVGALTSAGNFYPSLYLSGRGGGQPTLGAVNIGGVVKAGVWVVKGSGGAVSVFATTVVWSATYLGAVPSISTGGSYRGTFTASSIGSVSSGKDILQGKILAGAFLGDDGLMRGTGANADTFGAGTIGSVFAFRNIAGNLMGAGLDPVDGFFKNGNDRIVGGTLSSIGAITVQHVIGQVSRILTNVYSTITVGGAAVDWRTNSRFTLSTTGPVATVTSADVVDQGGVPTAAIAVRWLSTGLINLNSIASGVILVTGPGGFSSLVTLLISSLDASVHGAAGLSVFTVPLGAQGDPAPPGTYTITVVDGAVRDDRGNFSPGVDIGMFTV